MHDLDVKRADSSLLCSLNDRAARQLPRLQPFLSHDESSLHARLECISPSPSSVASGRRPILRLALKKIVGLLSERSDVRQAVTGKIVESALGYQGASRDGADTSTTQIHPELDGRRICSRGQ